MQHQKTIHTRRINNMCSHFLRTIALMWTLAAASGSLYAVDGVVLIDQPHALAGGITPADAPGFPITISQSGSYRLSGNLTVPDINTVAIEITGALVTIDLNGFSILGPNVCTSSQSGGVPTGVTCTGSTNGDGIVARTGALAVTVLNGVIHGMGGNGINLGFPGDGSNGNVRNVLADNNGGDGIFTSGLVASSIAMKNGASGIEAASVSNSVALGNGQEGINVTFGAASGNTATGNVNNGISSAVAGAYNNTVNGNGISIGANCPSLVVNNTEAQNASAGVFAGAGCLTSPNAVGN